MTKFIPLLIISFVLLLSQSYAFDHQYENYQKVLDQFVIFKDQQSYVNYQALKEKPENLNKALSSWQLVTSKEYSSWSSEQKLAFLINAYNGFTLKLIIDHYPVKSIKDIGSFFSSPWKKDFFKLFGKKTHLDYIEHEIIRKNFKEPRIHFAVNCASLGCPSLTKEAYLAHTLNDQLTKAAQSFITNPQRNRFDNKNKKAYLSAIFKWYGDDFKEMTGLSFHDFIKTVVPQYSPKDWQVQWLDYDWNLNDSSSLKK